MGERLVTTEPSTRWQVEKHIVINPYSLSLSRSLFPSLFLSYTLSCSLSLFPSLFSLSLSVTSLTLCLIMNNLIVSLYVHTKQCLLYLCVCVCVCVCVCIRHPHSVTYSKKHLKNWTKYAHYFSLSLTHTFFHWLKEETIWKMLGINKRSRSTYKLAPLSDES